MHNRTIMSLTAAMLLWPGVTGLPGRLGGPSTAAAEIRHLTQEFVAGYNSGDVERLLRFYSDRFIDANMRQPVVTREEHAAYYRQILERRDSEVEVTPEEIVVDGTHATVRGSLLIYKLDNLRHRSAPVERRYMELWERQPDGWKCIWGIDAELYGESQ